MEAMSRLTRREIGTPRDPSLQYQPTSKVKSMPQVKGTPNAKDAFNQNELGNRKERTAVIGLVQPIVISLDALNTPRSNHQCNAPNMSIKILKPLLPRPRPCDLCFRVKDILPRIVDSVVDTRRVPRTAHEKPSFEQLKWVTPSSRLDVLRAGAYLSFHFGNYETH